VTACPKNRYRTQTVHPLQPSVVHSMVPSASECAKPSGVSMVVSLGRREKKRRVLSAREGRKGIGPVKLNSEEMEEAIASVAADNDDVGSSRCS